MKTSDLTGAALDWAVAKCEKWFAEKGTPHNEALALEYFKFSPSTDWAQGGPIIEREGICIRPPRLTLATNGSTVSAKADGWFATNYTEFEGQALPRISRFGPTPLIAAMRCYVASKLGDEVDIPDEMK